MLSDSRAFAMPASWPGGRIWPGSRRGPVLPAWAEMSPLVFRALEARQSRASFVRYLVSGLSQVPQLLHPKLGRDFRSRLDHTRTLCQLARQLHADFGQADTSLWPLLLVRLACHDIGHTPYGHAGERVIQHVACPDFSNSRQSHRFMFADGAAWPEGTTPFGWYLSPPFRRLDPGLERQIEVIVEVFDDLENAVGDAGELAVLGRAEALRFLQHACSWSGRVPWRPGMNLAAYLRRVVMQEFAPSGFRDLALRMMDPDSPCRRSLDALRLIIARERRLCGQVAWLDSLAEQRIPVLFGLALARLQDRLPEACPVPCCARLAADMVASVNELELM